MQGWGSWQSVQVEEVKESHTHTTQSWVVLDLKCSRWRRAGLLQGWGSWQSAQVEEVKKSGTCQG